MLWSLLKILFFVAAVAAIAYGALWLMEAEGGVQIIVAQTEFTLGPLESAIALVVLLVALWLVLKLLSLLIATLRFINGDETALSRYFDRNRERKGLKELTESLNALAAGDGKTAMVEARKAGKHLNRPELTNLITAQAAEASGDHKTAEQVYRKLVEDDRTRFVGVRGLMKQKLAEGDTETALQLAQRAFALKPKHEETQDLLLKLQAGAHDWAGARKTLSAKLKQGALPRDVHKRRDAVLAVSEAKDVIDEGNDIKAREAAIEANRLSPDLIPAAVMAARGYIEQGKAKNAARIITKAWAAQPHPELAAAFAEIHPDESPQTRLKRFQTLVKAQPDHRESKLVMAELNIAAEDFPAARRALGDLVETDPDVRVLTIMAAIERGEGASDAVVQGWLARAVTAPRGPQWICENCNAIHPEWTPVCENCGAFDTLAWTRPASQEVSSPAGTAMLPLVVAPRGAAGSVEAGESAPPTEDAAGQAATDDAEAQEQDADSAAEAEPEPAEERDAEAPARST
ncbi:heme biosynthesis protein HemY [Rhodosalinus halophilus]|uniref:Heme biosynthesis protein HemY n=1 Tax=Rhodosalinus halophilus TaxID=2259333 RepID=A0A365U825_9RHOB|nr:heme biosynthesis HemY N-terminal domain-containing protein [Rhodosalinus halophilus]RBI84574.1 heme biosynthesis protein HemY [Rhodosalinus halophilus]